MPEPTQPPAGGVQYESKTGNLWASNEAVDRLSSMIERVASDAFGWSERNPEQFYFIIIAVVFVLVIRLRTKERMAISKREFEQARENAKRQLQLPFASTQKDREDRHEL